MSSESLVRPRPGTALAGPLAGTTARTATGDGPRLEPLRRGAGITVLVPAYNEAASIADTVRSLRQQTRAADEILVIDDCSTDGTGEAAAAAGACVIRVPRNTGSKAGAQNYGLRFVGTETCLAIDADTTLAPDAIEKIVAALEGTGVAAACGFVLPRRVRTVWERGRYVEYLFAFTFLKQVQDHYGKPLISSGCFSIYRTDVLRRRGGWPVRTVAEDMDLTWSLYEEGHEVRFVPEAVSYPIEPHDWHFLSCQLRRWSHGFMQNLEIHWRKALDVPVLRSMVAVTTWDALVASLLYLTLLPLFSAFVHPLFLVGYAIDLPAVAVPVLAAAWGRGEVGRALAGLPCFAVLRIVNSVFIVRAAWLEFVVRRRLAVFVKGH